MGMNKKVYKNFEHYLGDVLVKATQMTMTMEVGDNKMETPMSMHGYYKKDGNIVGTFSIESTGEPFTKETWLKAKMHGRSKTTVMDMLEQHHEG